MSVAIALPDPQTTTLAQLPRVIGVVRALRQQCRTRQDGRATLELKRRLDAFQKYVADKTAQATLVGELRLVEVLIGELLGPAEIGRPSNRKSPSWRLSDLSDHLRYDFRRMAAFAPQVERLVAGGVVDRAAILRRLPASPAIDRSAKSLLNPVTTLQTFNQVNDNIGWARWSWNPVTGCLHNCDYCYARDIAERFYPQKFEPTFLPERLVAPANTKLPATATDDPAWRRVFTCSMADLFGKWVPQEWITAVFDRIRQHPEWEFLCLTKFPDRLAELEWPSNVWAGTTVDRQHRVANAERSFRGVKAGVKWLSCEPLLEPLQFSSLEMFDWVVIGASTGSRQADPFAPPFEWVVDLYRQARAAGCRVYLKHNLFGAVDGHQPGMQGIREWPR
jgi:protein gp37